MYRERSDDGYREALPGVALKTTVWGAHTLFTEFRLECGRELPAHSHPQEQTGYLVSGHIRLRIGDETFDVLPGGSWCIPGDVVHGADILADSVAIEVFSPVREDYLPGA